MNVLLPLTLSSFKNKFPSLPSASQGLTNLRTSVASFYMRQQGVAPSSTTEESGTSASPQTQTSFPPLRSRLSAYYPARIKPEDLRMPDLSKFRELLPKQPSLLEKMARQVGVRNLQIINETKLPVPEKTIAVYKQTLPKLDVLDSNDNTPTNEKLKKINYFLDNLSTVSDILSSSESAEKKQVSLKAIFDKTKILPLMIGDNILLAKKNEDGNPEITWITAEGEVSKLEVSASGIIPRKSAEQNILDFFIMASFEAKKVQAKTDGKLLRNITIPFPQEGNSSETTIELQDVARKAFQGEHKEPDTVPAPSEESVTFSFTNIIEEFSSRYRNKPEIQSQTIKNNKNTPLQTALETFASFTHNADEEGNPSIDKTIARLDKTLGIELFDLQIKDLPETDELKKYSKLQAIFSPEALQTIQDAPPAMPGGDSPSTAYKDFFKKHGIVKIDIPNEKNKSFVLKKDIDELGNPQYSLLEVDAFEGTVKTHRIHQDHVEKNPLAPYVDAVSNSINQAIDPRVVKGLKVASWALPMAISVAGFFHPINPVLLGLSKLGSIGVIAPKALNLLKTGQMIGDRINQASSSLFSQNFSSEDLVDGLIDRLSKAAHPTPKEEGEATDISASQIIHNMKQDLGLSNDSFSTATSNTPFIKGYSDLSFDEKVKALLYSHNFQRPEPTEEVDDYFNEQKSLRFAQKREKEKASEAAMSELNDMNERLTASGKVLDRTQKNLLQISQSVVRNQTIDWTKSDAGKPTIWNQITDKTFSGLSRFAGLFSNPLSEALKPTIREKNLKELTDSFAETEKSAFALGYDMQKGIVISKNEETGQYQVSFTLSKDKEISETIRSFKTTAKIDPKELIRASMNLQHELLASPSKAEAFDNTAFKEWLEDSFGKDNVRQDSNFYNSVKAETVETKNRPSMMLNSMIRSAIGERQIGTLESFNPTIDRVTTPPLSRPSLSMATPALGIFGTKQQTSLSHRTTTTGTFSVPSSSTDDTTTANATLDVD